MIDSEAADATRASEAFVVALRGASELARSGEVISRVIIACLELWTAQMPPLP